MDRDRTRRIYDLHSWTGLLFGLFIFVVSLSGVLALFGREVGIWAEPAARIDVPRPAAPVMPALRDFIDEVTVDRQLSGITLHLPDMLEPYATAFVAVSDPETRERQVEIRRWTADTGEPMAPHGDGLSHWLIDFHARLMLPRTPGRAVVGIAGIAMLLLTVSGLVTHRKMVSEFFTWRLDRSVRLMWQDSHKAIGLWGTPFHLMIAFTGAWLGMVAILVAIASVLVFKGDQAALFETLSGPFDAPSGVAAEMVSLDRAAAAVQQQTGRWPEIVTIEFWGDAEAHYTFLVPSEGTLTRYLQVEVGAVDGEIRRSYITTRDGITFRLTPAMVALHYGSFAGLWLKLLYAVLGILLCLMTATGLMLWIERRRHGNAGRAGPAFYDWSGRLALGVVAGMVLASIAIFHVERLHTGAAEDRLTVIGSRFFAVWLAGLLYGLVQPSGYRATRHLLGLSAIAALTLPLHDLALHGITATAGNAGLSRLHPVAAAVDAAALLTGLTLALSAAAIPRTRPAGRPRTQRA